MEGRPLQKRAIAHSQGSHGMPGLNVKWELSPVTVEVRETRAGLWKLAVRLCSVVGGVFATSQILASAAAALFSRRGPAKA